MKLTACLIVKNEESCLRSCLESIKHFDEIIVVDTGSTDNTCRIAREYTNKVYENQYTWEDSFCKARNFALSKCTGDWVLSIDADEVFEYMELERLKQGACRAEAAGHKTLMCNLVSQSNGDSIYFPRFFKRCNEVFWKGDIHNYLSRQDNNKTNIRIFFGYSEAHKQDPDRSFRILLKSVRKNPEAVREVFYLAREYFYRKYYREAIFWYKDYLTRANWPPEWSEAWLKLSRCYLAIGQVDLAKDACLQAIKINADFKEALQLMADLSGPKNREKWLLYAQYATNNNVWMVREPKEKGSEYYDNLFRHSQDMSRYQEIHTLIGKLVGEGKVLDCGCGLGTLQHFIKNYSGFDFSEEAVKLANHPNVVVGDIYDKQNYLADYDILVSTEVLEHIDDLKFLSNIPTGKRIIFSVPNFKDESHLRIYTENIIKHRFNALLNINKIHTFYWNDRWVLNGNQSKYCIYLVEAIRK